MIDEIPTGIIQNRLLAQSLITHFCNQIKGRYSSQFSIMFDARLEAKKDLVRVLHLRVYHKAMTKEEEQEAFYG